MPRVRFLPMSFFRILHILRANNTKFGIVMKVNTENSMVSLDFVLWIPGGQSPRGSIPPWGNFFEFSPFLMKMVPHLEDIVNKLLGIQQIV